MKATTDLGLLLKSRCLSKRTSDNPVDWLQYRLRSSFAWWNESLVGCYYLMIWVYQPLVALPCDVNKVDATKPWRYPCRGDCRTHILVNNCLPPQIVIRTPSVCSPSRCGRICCPPDARSGKRVAACLRRSRRKSNLKQERSGRSICKYFFTMPGPTHYLHYPHLVMFEGATLQFH